MIKIRLLLKSEIDLLKNFPPEDWNIDLPGFISFHFGRKYFYPIVAEENNKIVGFGNGILNGQVGWLGNILVPPEYRRRGIGHEITEHLVNHFKSNRCITQLLIASEMGKNIYKKIGFEVSSEYHFFNVEPNFLTHERNINIRKIREDDFLLFKKFDEKITGEKRFEFIKRFLPAGWVYKEKRSKKIEGVYLPELGSGLIFAENPEAGLELLKFKLSSGKTRTVIPSGNKIALDFLIANGCRPYSTAPRMVLGKEVSWQPKYIFNRAAGYCG
jgi:GNAT superfamily N-acetyltransferase